MGMCESTLAMVVAGPPDGTPGEVLGVVHEASIDPASKITDARKNALERSCINCRLSHYYDFSLHQRKRTVLEFTRRPLVLIFDCSY